MKTIEQVLSECPKHDCAYVLYGGRWHRIEEHEVRALQAAIAEGDLDNKGVRIKFGGRERVWSGEIPWRFDDLYDTNIFSLSVMMMRKVYRVEMAQNEEWKKQHGLRG